MRTTNEEGRAMTANNAQEDPLRGARPVGAPFEETIAGDERLRVQVLATADGRFGFVAQCGYQACDGPFRDTYAGTETFDSEREAREAGIIKARQLAGIDVPEA